MPDFPERPADAPLFAQHAALSTQHSSPTPRRDRIRGQYQRMLTLFQNQPEVSNRQLAAISLKYTGRISDLRRMGYDIVCVRQDRHTGESWYALNSEPPPPLGVK